jgi:hypothetical protein
MLNAQALAEDEADILKHEVSTDGVNWRPYNPAIDPDHGLHRRIEFAPPPVPAR